MSFSNDTKYAVVFNESIQRLLEFGKTCLQPQGFKLLEVPELQEDSGDLVSSESISIVFRHQTQAVDLRFFLCCGKGPIEDFLQGKFISQKNPLNFIDLGDLSQKTGGSLAHFEFNAQKWPMSDFLDRYLDELAIEFESLFESGLNELEQNASKPLEGFSLR